MTELHLSYSQLVDLNKEQKIEELQAVAEKARETVAAGGKVVLDDAPHDIITIYCEALKLERWIATWLLTVPLYYLDEDGNLRQVSAEEVSTFTSRAITDGGKRVSVLQLKHHQNVVVHNPADVERQIATLRAQGVMAHYLPFS